jgi:transposase
MRCFRTRGKKGEEHFDPDHPPRRRANKRRGRGTYANDRPPILGTVGRESGQVRLRMVEDTTGRTLRDHVHQFTQGEAIVNTDEYQSYNGLNRLHDTVGHGRNEWARDDDSDGFCEVHCNSVEGMWTDVRNFLRPFKGVHKKFLAGYLALCEFRRNLKRISSTFISDSVRFHSFYP